MWQMSYKWGSESVPQFLIWICFLQAVCPLVSPYIKGLTFLISTMVMTVLLCLPDKAVKGIKWSDACGSALRWIKTNRTCSKPSMPCKMLIEN